MLPINTFVQYKTDSEVLYGFIDSIYTVETVIMVDINKCKQVNDWELVVEETLQEYVAVSSLKPTKVPQNVDSFVFPFIQKQTAVVVRSTSIVNFQELKFG